MGSWEYKILEFTGSLSTLQGFLVQESHEEWELGALLPTQTLQGGDLSLGRSVAPVSQGVYVIFKRQIPIMQAATSSLAR